MVIHTSPVDESMSYEKQQQQRKLNVWPVKLESDGL